MKLLVIPSWWPDAHSVQQGIFFREQCECLRSAGHDLAVVHADVKPRGAAVPRLRAVADCGLEYRAALPSRIPRTGVGNRDALRRAAKKAADAAVTEVGVPDVILAFHADPAGWLAADASRRLAVPFVLSEHASFTADFSTLSYRRLVLDAFRTAGLVTAPSRFLADRLRAQGLASAPAVWPNLIRTDYFSLDHAPACEQAAILGVGNLVSVKGWDLLLDAYSKALGLDARLPRLRLVGQGPELEDLQARAAALGLADRVDFVAPGSRAQIRREMQQAAFLVVPSRVETFSIVTLEAMSCGKPVLATRCGGPEELITPDVGHLVEPERVDALAEGLGFMTAACRDYDPTMLRRWACRFGAEAFVARFEALVTPLIQS
jgi:teichuronic acid biosynthesis glycosyltransferase TuaC